ncbi:tetratricopeptide repeat-containing sensor histidine kinase [Elizabethkingia meningoseptica]|uniref:tetratricopeptide repeat-containing sensor histidine kinase n=1 Tax=Elizabethkingia meningoseptica TaxID=238 RepID=UPI000B35D532|nr:sensor histidine kinase [Elizabethkingia meningoseptica]
MRLSEINTNMVKKKTIIFVFFMLVFSLMYGQKLPKTDSLNKVLKSAKTDTARISVLGKIARNYLLQNNDSVKAFDCAYKARALARENSSGLYKAYADQNINYLHTALMHTDSAVFYSNRVIARLKNDHSPQAVRMIVASTNTLAIMSAAKGGHKKSAELLISNLPRLERIKDYNLLSTTLHNIAHTFIDMGEYNKADSYLVRSLNILEKHNGDPGIKAHFYLTEASLQYNIGNIKSMRGYLDKAKENIDKTTNLNISLGRYYSYSAKYYAKINKLQEADRMLDKALHEYEKFKGRYHYYDVYWAKEEVAVAKKNYREARDIASNIYQKSIEDKYDEGVLMASKNISEYSESLGDYKTAYEYLKKYSSYEDSIKREKMLLEAHDLEARYKNSEKERQITKLQAESQQASLKNKNQQLLNWLLGGGLVVFLLIIAFLIYIERNNRKLSTQKLKEVEQMQALKQTQAMLEGEERERERVARDLHDGLGGTLSGIKLKLSGQQKKENIPAIDHIILQLEGSINELRNISRNLMPEALVRSGLEVALHDLCNSLNRDEMMIEFQSAGIQKTISMASQVNIYRIIQELLSNAIRHSQADKIILQCIQEEKRFFITIEDNGCGFDPENIKNTKGIGCSSIRNRVNYMNGKLEIDSVIDQGTTINIELNV